MATSRRRFLSGLAAVSAGAAVGGCRRSTTPADLIFVGGPVLTVTPWAPEAEALAVTGGRISAVGDAVSVLRLHGPKTELVDLVGRALLPAFVEPHGHPFEVGTTLAPPAVDVRPFTVPTAAGVLAKLSAAVADTRKGHPILLNGVDPLLQPGLHPFTRSELDRLCPHNPVVIIANSGHAAYGNTAAFAAAHITAATPDPTGAQFVRGSNGLTGEVREAGALMALMAPFAGAFTSNAGDNLRWAYGQLARAGIATATEHSYDARTQAKVFTEVAEAPDCPVRVRAYEIGTPELARDPGNARRGRRSGAEVMFDKIGMKLWADGSPWQGNIFTTFPYLTNPTTAAMGLGPNHRGAMNYTPEQILMLAKAFTRQRWQLSCHVHGDAAIDVVLNAFGKAHVPASSRPRLEHVGAMRPDQFDRAAAMGVTPSMFIEHVYYWGDVLVDKLFGREHGARWMAARSAFEAGLRVSFHNDSPVTPPDPIGNIATAVTRVARGSGRVLAPEQRIGVDAAIRAQTLNAAWKLRLDGEIGSLEPGKYADLVVLSANPRQLAPEQLRDVAVEATFLMGRQTFGKLLD